MSTGQQALPFAFFDTTFTETTASISGTIKDVECQPSKAFTCFGEKVYLLVVAHVGGFGASPAESGASFGNKFVADEVFDIPEDIGDKLHVQLCEQVAKEIESRKGISRLPYDEQQAS